MADFSRRLMRIDCGLKSPRHTLIPRAAATNSLELTSLLSGGWITLENSYLESIKPGKVSQPFKRTHHEAHAGGFRRLSQHGRCAGLQQGPADGARGDAGDLLTFQRSSSRSTRWPTASR